MEPLCKNFYSHPKIILKDHLKDVGLLCRRYVEESGIRNEKILKTAEFIGKCHDFGKYTEFFQEYLADNKKIKRELTNHSYLSAIFSSWVIYKKIEDLFLALASFLCVKSHHGNLISLNNIEMDPEFIKNNPIIKKQVDSIRKNLSIISKELEELNIFGLEDFIEKFDEHIDKMSEALRKFISKRQFNSRIKEENYWREYYTVLLLFSSLIDADKKDAGRVYKFEKFYRSRISISSKLIEEYRERKFKQDKHRDINILREILYQDVKKSLNKNLNKVNEREIITLTAPTGTGKTILGLYTALKMKEILKKDHPLRIIYSLPYISIIEQTYSVFEEILSKDLSAYSEIVPISLLLKYHHLFFPKEEIKNEIPLDKLLLIVDSWESEIIVTTFIQLLHSIIGCNNSFIKKFHNITNSIIILDEVQALPMEYWKLIKDALINLIKIFNVTIIFMTATMPIIFKKENSNELISNYKNYYKKLDRTIFKSHIEKEMNIDELVNLFFEIWNSNKSALIVLNTIKTSINVYKKIAKRLDGKIVRLGSKEEKEKLNDNSMIILSYLSSNIIPKERKRRIEVIKNMLKNGRKAILVSTQVVEAGVDLDFDMVIRDIAPLDSINQAAGRCNRNWRMSKGELHIVSIIDKEGRMDAEKIYGRILIEITLNLLKRKKEFTENELVDIIEEYYREIFHRLNIAENEKSKNLISKIREMNFSELKDFSLIEEEPKISVFIEYDDEASKILREFRGLWNRRNDIIEKDKVFEYKAKLREIRTKLENYIINVWSINKSLNDIEQKLNIKYVPYNVLDAYYDGETGFLDITEEGATII